MGEYCPCEEKHIPRTTFNNNNNNNILVIFFSINMEIAKQEQLAKTFGDYSGGIYSWVGPHGQPIGYWNLDQAGIKFLIKLGLNLDEVGTNSAMTHILVLGAKLTRNEWL